MDEHWGLREATAHVQTEGNVASALRALQVLDQVSAFDHRVLLSEAQTALGEELGLTCTGVDEGDGFFSHDAGTCPIHEWLCPDEDHARAAQIAGGKPA